MNWLIVALLAVNVVAWGSELLGPESGRPIVVLELGDSEVLAASPPDAGLRAPELDSPGMVQVEQRAERGSRGSSRKALAVPLPAGVHAWIADLADDDVRWNATAALRQLDECSDQVVPLLQAALDSSDFQQRQLAGVLLRARDAEPTPDLLRVSLEALHSDGLALFVFRTRDGVENGGHATNYLLRHHAAVGDQLMANLQSIDAQERFLSAYILGRTRDERAVQRTCNVLIGHLRDNHVRADARLAADALSSLGDLARPHMQFARPRVDDQALELLDLLLYDESRPRPNAAEREHRSNLHPRAVRHYDPEIPEDPERMMRLNWWKWGRWQGY